jgi:YegS/Rv2252/BmrU family lipid kinase
VRALLIANPGARQGEWLLEPARAAFAKAGVPVDVVITEARGHGGRVARERVTDYDFVFTLGGDGTAMEVINALSDTGRPVAVLAGGTGNLLARVLGVPLDVAHAVPALLAGVEKRIDLGVLGDGRRFAIAAGTGVDSDMIAAAPLEFRRRFGVLAYFATASTAELRMQPFAVRATVDGRIIERGDCIGAMVVNMGSVLDGWLELGPRISYDDGLLDLCVFSAANPIDVAMLAGRVAFRDFAEGRQMVFAKGAQIDVEVTPAREFEADGELMGPTPISARIDPLAAPLLVPRRGN